jgi:hypothetical protein
MPCGVSKCGVTTFDLPVSSRMLVLVDVIPSGLKIRVFMNSSHVPPVAWARTCPAVMYVRLL